MRWVEIKGKWFDQERLEMFYFHRYKSENWYLFLRFIGSEDFFRITFDDDEEMRQAQTFLENLIQQHYYAYRFVKEVKKAPEPKKVEKKKPSGYLESKVF